MHKIDITDPEGLDKFLYQVEADFGGSLVTPRRAQVISTIRNRLLSWADTQASGEKQKELRHKITEFLRRMESVSPDSEVDRSPDADGSVPTLLGQEENDKDKELLRSDTESKQEESEEEPCGVPAAGVDLPAEPSVIAQNDEIYMGDDASFSPENSYVDEVPPPPAHEHSAEIPIHAGNDDNPFPRDPEETETCDICYEDVKRSNMYTLACHHRYCRDCLREHLTVRVHSGWLLTIPCLHPSCSESIPDSDVRALVDKDIYSKYKRFQELAEISAMPTSRWCPKPDCNTAVVGDPHDEAFPCLVCHKCETKFCSDCSQEWHPNFTCQENAKRNRSSRDKKSDKWRKKHKVRKCAQCAVDIEKDSGCNHMKCVTCGYEFCWICMQQFTVSWQVLCS